MRIGTKYRDVYVSDIIFDNLVDNAIIYNDDQYGASLKASNFKCDGIAGGTHWTGKRNRKQNIPYEMKTRWSKN